MLQHNVIENNYAEYDINDDQTQNTLAIAKEKWRKQRTARKATGHSNMNKAHRQVAPLLTRTENTDQDDLQGCIKQRIDRMEKVLAEQDRMARKNHTAERMNDLMGPAMRSVIRGRERMLSILSGNGVL